MKLFSLGLALSLATAVVPPTTALWHNKLVASIPKKDEKLDKSPQELRLWFKEPIEPKLSGLTLIGPDKKKVAIGKIQGTDDSTSFKAEVPKALPAGRYTINWRTVGTDGHKVKGNFSFVVK